MTEYIWDVVLECGHDLVVEKFVPGRPAHLHRCFHEEHGGEMALSVVVTAHLRGDRHVTNAERLSAMIKEAESAGEDVGEWLYDTVVGPLALDRSRYHSLVRVLHEIALADETIGNLLENVLLDHIGWTKTPEVPF